MRWRRWVFASRHCQLCQAGYGKLPPLAESATRTRGNEKSNIKNFPAGILIFSFAVRTLPELRRQSMALPDSANAYLSNGVMAKRDPRNTPLLQHSQKNHGGLSCRAR